MPAIDFNSLTDASTGGSAGFACGKSAYRRGCSGQFKAGKSSFINSLLGQAVLPSAPSRSPPPLRASNMAIVNEHWYVTSMGSQLK